MYIYASIVRLRNFDAELSAGQTSPLDWRYTSPRCILHTTSTYIHILQDSLVIGFQSYILRVRFTRYNYKLILILHNSLPHPSYYYLLLLVIFYTLLSSFICADLEVRNVSKFMMTFTIFNCLSIFFQL